MQPNPNQGSSDNDDEVEDYGEEESPISLPGARGRFGVEFIYLSGDAKQRYVRVINYHIEPDFLALTSSTR